MCFYAKLIIIWKRRIILEIYIRAYIIFIIDFYFIYLSEIKIIKCIRDSLRRTNKQLRNCYTLHGHEHMYSVAHLGGKCFPGTVFFLSPLVFSRESISRNSDGMYPSQTHRRKKKVYIFLINRRLEMDALVFFFSKPPWKKMIRGGRNRITSPPAFSNDAKKLLLCTANSVSIFSVATGSKLASLEGHTAPVTTVVVDPILSEDCWTASLDGKIRFWDFSVPKLVQAFDIHLPIYSMVTFFVSQLNEKQKNYNLSWIYFIGYVYMSTVK